MLDQATYRENLVAIRNQRQGQLEDEKKSLFIVVSHLAGLLEGAETVLAKELNNEERPPFTGTSLWMLDNLGDHAWSAGTTKSKVDSLIKEIEILDNLIFSIDHPQGN